VPASAHTYRLFVSSTFMDFAAEREALHRHVFPALEELCRSAGARFQAVDLRWGISPEAEREQQTLAICLAEIDRSRRVTPRPNFLILLGARYGWQPPPAVIPALDFEEAMARVTDAEERARLSDGYRRDDNSQPAVYLLQPRTNEAGPSESSTRAERRLAARLAELGNERGSPSRDRRGRPRVFPGDRTTAEQTPMALVVASKAADVEGVGG
jgi:Domain of unknown function (DUF4062)